MTPHPDTTLSVGGGRPVRLQLSRKKGFDLQAHSRAVNGLPAVVVARPTRLGNPWKVRQLQQSGHWYVEGPRLITPCYCGNREGAQLLAVKFFRQHVAEGHFSARSPTGHNLACWCALDAPCHADVLLELANGPVCEPLDAPPATPLATGEAA